MRIVHRLPRAVHVIENCWIPLSDGCRLAARLWLPRDAETRPVPAILEYIPYRKRDFTRARDEPMHGYFAGHGYAAVRVDLRGSGESDGVLLDEYLEQEQQDALEVIRWIAAQRWCTGAVGMMGKSWGGFNSLQVAARRPPELKAVLTVCSTDDRYADDVHFMGGCLLNENLSWGSVLMDYTAYPPDPALAGPRWREMWLERLQNAVCFPAVWLQHQRRDDYWKHGSVCENYDAIACPVYAVGGWADAYSNAIPRLLAGLRVPRKGLIGPWAHVYPHDGVPEPAIGFLQEALRWWDHWLKRVDNGTMAEPLLRAWMAESTLPKSFALKRPGRWVAETHWPSPRIRLQRYWLGRERLSRAKMKPARLDVSTPQTTGLAAGEWCPFGVPGEAPRDQRSDDAYSLVFDSDPLAERLEILGAPVLTVDVAADRPVALLAVRLNDVAPDGASTLVTYGILNLTHREGHENPVPLKAGKRYRVTVALNDVAHAFFARHTVRVAISTTYWPLVWPPPHRATVTVFTGNSFLALPRRAPDPSDGRLETFEPPESAPSAAVALRAPPLKRIIERDVAADETVYTIGEEGWAPLTRIAAIDLEAANTSVKRFRIREDDPLSARAECAHRTEFRRGEWHVRIETTARLSATEDHFLLEAELYAFEGGEQVFARKWEERIRRDLI